MVSATTWEELSRGDSGTPMRRSALAALFAVIVLPIPLVTASGLSIPLPTFVESIAFALVPGAGSEMPVAAPTAPKGVTITHTRAESIVHALSTSGSASVVRRGSGAPAPADPVLGGVTLRATVTAVAASAGRAVQESTAPKVTSAAPVAVPVKPVKPAVANIGSSSAADNSGTGSVGGSSGNSGTGSVGGSSGNSGSSGTGNAGGVSVGTDGTSPSVDAGGVVAGDNGLGNVGGVDVGNAGGNGGAVGDAGGTGNGGGNDGGNGGGKANGIPEAPSPVIPGGNG